MSETTQKQLPAWAKEAGWTAADVADGWYVDVDDFMAHKQTGISTDDTGGIWGMDDITCESSEFATATSPAAARQCALDIVNAIKRARGDQG